MAVPNRVREVRQAHGQSLRDVQAATGIDLSQLSKVENGVGNISDERKFRLAEHFGVRVTDLFFVESVESQDTATAKAGR